jgi:hypothetical protein
MFGVNKEQLVKGLCRVSCRLCGYLGSICDCKYMLTSDDFRTGSEETGCPETAMAATLINAMTLEEFYIIAHRAGIQVDPSEEESIELAKTFSNMKKQRNDHLIANIGSKK